MRRVIMTSRTVVSRPWLPGIWTVALLVAGLGAAHGEVSPSVERGMAYAQANCGQCHSVDRISPSADPAAPPFRDLHLRYPAESLSEALAEGLTTGHQAIPEVRLEPTEIGDFIDFLNSL